MESEFQWREIRTYQRWRWAYPAVIFGGGILFMSLQAHRLAALVLQVVVGVMIPICWWKMLRAPECPRCRKSVRMTFVQVIASMGKGGAWSSKGWLEPLRRFFNPLCMQCSLPFFTPRGDWDAWPEEPYL